MLAPEQSWTPEKGGRVPQRNITALESGWAEVGCAAGCVLSYVQPKSYPNFP